MTRTQLEAEIAALRGELTLATDEDRPLLTALIADAERELAHFAPTTAAPAVIDPNDFADEADYRDAIRTRR